MARKLTAKTFFKDSLYPRVVRAVQSLLAKGKVVTPVDVLIKMNLLQPKSLEDWRFGRVNYLERVITCNLTKLSRLLRILRFHAFDLKLSPSTTFYKRWGLKGRKLKLRFTKTGDPRLEEAYSRHFVWKGKCPFHLPKKMPDYLRKVIFPKKVTPQNNQPTVVITP